MLEYITESIVVRNIEFRENLVRYETILSPQSPEFRTTRDPELPEFVRFRITECVWHETLKKAV